MVNGQRVGRNASHPRFILVLRSKLVGKSIIIFLSGQPVLKTKPGKDINCRCIRVNLKARMVPIVRIVHLVFLNAHIHLAGASISRLMLEYDVFRDFRHFMCAHKMPFTLVLAFRGLMPVAVSLRMHPVPDHEVVGVVSVNVSFCAN